MQTTIKVNGMTCKHCKMRVGKAISNLNFVDDVTVDLKTGNVEIKHDDSGEILPAIIQAVDAAGYSVEK